MLFFNNPIFLRKFPLIKLQRPRKNQQQLKISFNGLLYFALFIFRGFFRALPIPAVSQRSTLCARVLVKIPQPISGFWDLSTSDMWSLTSRLPRPFDGHFFEHLEPGSVPLHTITWQWTNTNGWSAMNLKASTLNRWALTEDAAWYLTVLSFGYLIKAKS